MGARGGEFEPGMSVLVGSLLFWTCLFVCSSQIPCCPNCICVTRTSRGAELPSFCRGPQTEGGGGILQKDVLFKVGSLGAKCSAVPIYHVVLHKCKIQHFCWNKTSDSAEVAA